MKSMDFFARLGVDPQSHCQCGKGMQGRMAEKDAISCRVFGETDYWGRRATLTYSITSGQSVWNHWPAGRSTRS